MPSYELTTIRSDEWNDPFDSEPEALWAHAQRQHVTYHAVSRSRAELFDGWGALHAQVAADSATVQEVSLRFVGGLGAQGRAEFLQVGNALSRAATNAFGQAAEARNAAQVVARLRGDFLEMFIGQTADDIKRALDPLEHLRTADPQRRDPWAGYARFDGEQPAAYRHACRRRAAELAAEAADDEFQGRRAEGVEKAYRADLAAFEAYLLDAAHAVADLALATVDLRWDAAARLLAASPPLADRIAQSVPATRAVLYQVVGPVEWTRLVHYLPEFAAAS